jgi:TadE-like protein
MRRKLAGSWERGQSLIELALVVPVLLLLVLGLVAVGRILHAQAAVDAIAHDAARAAAIASSPEQAARAGRDTGLQTGANYGFQPPALLLVVDAQGFGRGGVVSAEASCTVPFDDLPLLGWAHVPVHSQSVQPVDRYRPLLPTGDQP